MDLQRVLENEKIRMRFRCTSRARRRAGREDAGRRRVAPAERRAGECLPKDLPEFLEIDLSAMEINDIKRLSDMPLPAGVELVDLAHGRDEAVVSIHHPRAEEVEAPAAEAAPQLLLPRLLPVLLLRLLLERLRGWRSQEGRGKPAAPAGAAKAAAAPKKEGGKK